MKYAIFLFFLSCARIPNYKNTPHGLEVYRKTKPGQEVRDIMSNGDTLVTTATKIYLITKKDTVWIIR